MGYGQIGLGLIVLVVYLPALLLFKSRGGHAEGIRSAGGFMNAIMRKAASTAFNLTIGFVVALSILDRTVLSHFTAKSAIRPEVRAGPISRSASPRKVEAW